MHGAWLTAPRRYLLAIVGGNLAWEFLQLPLYTIWHEGTPGEIVFAAVHCTAGDVLIAESALLAAILIVADGRWPLLLHRQVRALVLYRTRRSAFRAASQTALGRTGWPIRVDVGQILRILHCSIGGCWQRKPKRAPKEFGEDEECQEALPFGTLVEEVLPLVGCPSSSLRKPATFLMFLHELVMNRRGSSRDLRASGRPSIIAVCALQ